MGGVARSTGNLYDLDGNRIRIIHPDTSFFTFEADGLGRPTWIRENGGAPVTYFSYDSAGRRASSAWGMSTYAYDAAGRLQTLSHNPAGSGRDHDLVFTYNPASQVLTRSATNEAYAWGAADTYVRSYAANGLNQYTGATSTGAPNVSFGYDANGNLTSDGGHAFVYDVENRLVSATGAHNSELVYDPLGRLFQVSSGGAGVRRLVYDGDALVAEYDSAGNMPHRYIHGNDPGADDPLVWYHNAAAGWRQILLTDHQGSVIGVADMYGQPVATNSYDPWGIPAAANAGRFGYTGQAWVPELGLWYYKARFYSPTTGRFLQVDPVGYKDQMNLYAYVGNDPVNHLDPSGLNRDCVLRRAGECTGPGEVEVPRIGNQWSGKKSGSARGVCAGRWNPDLCPAGPRNPESRGRHHYDFFLRGCKSSESGCSESAVFEAWRHNSAPGAGYAQAGSHNVMLTGGNPIRQTVDPSSRTIVNETLPPHRYYSGTVTISIGTRDGYIGAQVTGLGNNGKNAIENAISGPILFGGLGVLAYYDLHPYHDTMSPYVHH